MVAVPWCVIEAERRGMAFEEIQRTKRAGYIDPNLQEELAEKRRQQLSTTDKFLDWADRRRWSLIGGSWAVSMAGACIRFGLRLAEWKS